MPILFGKWNSHANFQHTYITSDNKNPIPELTTLCVNPSENCLHMSVTTYIQTHVKIHTETYLSRQLYKICIIFFQDLSLLQS